MRLYQFTVVMFVIAMSCNGSCSENKAVKYIKAVDPFARCEKLTTHTIACRGDYDSAVCITGGQVIYCSAYASGGSQPDCKLVREVTPEDQTRMMESKCPKCN